MTLRQSGLLIILPTMLAACGSLVDLGPKGPPDAIYRLEPLARGEQSGEGPLIYVEEPEMSGSLDTSRIAIEAAPRSISYLASARWEERAPLLIQRHIARSLDNQSGVSAVGSLDFDLPVAARLKLDIRDFEVKQIDSGTPVVIIAASAVLSSATSAELLGRVQIETSETAAGDAPAEIVAAFNRALDALARDLAVFVTAAMAEGDV